MRPNGDICGAPFVEASVSPEALRAVLERVVGQAPFGFALYSQDLRYLMVNDQLAALNGRPANAHLNLSVYEVVPELAHQIAASLRQVLETGEPIIDTEVVGITPGEPGRRGIWLNSFYRITGTGGELLGVAALARDVTEVRRLQEQLATEQFRAALDASLEPVLMASVRPAAPPTAGPTGSVVDGDDDSELWVEYLNPAGADASGLRPADAVGRRLVDLFPIVGELGLDVEYARVFHTGVPFVARGLLCASPGPDGQDERFDVSVTRTPGGLLVSWRTTELENRLLEQQVELMAERQRVAQLQRSFLPRRLPRLPGTSLAARYRSAERDAPLGGDWYDAVALDDQLVVAIGDVAGHGMGAVEVMGVARITTRAYVAEDPSPDQVLARLDRYAARMPAGGRAWPLMTMIAAAYRPADRSFRWSNAGHLPPLLVDGAGPRLLHTTPHPPLGAGSTAHQAHSVVLEAGSTLVLFTDGLVERRGELLDEGFGRLLAAAADLPDEADSVCDALLERCLDPLAHDDDVCLVVLRTT